MTANNDNIVDHNVSNNINIVKENINTKRIYFN